MRDARQAPWADWLLLILFVGFQVADIASTNYALANPGGSRDQSVDGVLAG